MKGPRDHPLGAAVAEEHRRRQAGAPDGDESSLERAGIKIKNSLTPFHPPHFAVVQVREAIEQPEKPGQPPPLAIGDENEPGRGPAFISLIFIGINLAVFFLIQMNDPAFTYGFSVIPAEITGGTDIVGTRTIDAGGQRAEVPQTPGPDPIQLTLLSSMFMHGGIAHILGNMLFLWIFGNNIEDRLGHVRYLLFYLAAGVAATHGSADGTPPAAERSSVGAPLPGVSLRIVDTGEGELGAAHRQAPDPVVEIEPPCLVEGGLEVSPWQPRAL